VWITFLFEKINLCTKKEEKNFKIRIKYYFVTKKHLKWNKMLIQILYFRYKVMNEKKLQINK